MALRLPRSLSHWHRRRLNPRDPLLSTARSAAPTRPSSPSSRRGPPGLLALSAWSCQRCHFATVSDPIDDHLHARGALAEEATGLDRLLRALQTRDAPGLQEAFVQWAAWIEVADPGDAVHRAVVSQAQELPTLTVSEILRSLDPLLAPEIDPAYGINIQQRHYMLTDLGKHIDAEGVRKVHRETLAALKWFFFVRSEGPLAFLARDYEVAMRCAGMASDDDAAHFFWDLMSRSPLRWERGTTVWNQYIKAMFLTEPAYYQHDRTRPFHTPKNLHTAHRPLSRDVFERAETLRMSRNKHRILPLGRRRGAWSEDLFSRLRHRHGPRSARDFIRRSRATGMYADEEQIAAHLVALSRSKSLRHMCRYFGRTMSVSVRGGPLLHGAKRMRLESGNPIRQAKADSKLVHTGMKLPLNWTDNNMVSVTGGRDYPLGHPRRPTERLLDAIVEAFGSTGEVALAIKLVDFFSRKYELPIPPSVWSSLFHWAYVGAIKLHTQYNTILQKRDSNVPRLTPTQVNGIWDLMTGSSYGVVPSLEDYHLHLKLAIETYRLSYVAGAIRDVLVPRYRALRAQYEEASDEEVLQWATFPSYQAHHAAVKRRRLLETQCDYVRSMVNQLVHKMIREISKRPGHKTLVSVLLPNLLREVGEEFVEYPIQYNTAAGRVSLREPNHTKHSRWETVLFKRMVEYKWSSTYDRVTPDWDLGGRNIRLRQTAEIDARERAQLVWPAPQVHGKQKNHQRLSDGQVVPDDFDISSARMEEGAEVGVPPRRRDIHVEGGGRKLARVRTAVSRPEMPPPTADYWIRDRRPPLQTGRKRAVRARHGSALTEQGDEEHVWEALKLNRML